MQTKRQKTTQWPTPFTMEESYLIQQDRRKSRSVHEIPLTHFATESELNSIILDDDDNLVFTLCFPQSPTKPDVVKASLDLITLSH